MKEELFFNNLSIIDSYPKDDEPCIFLANHTCIRDAFYIPKAINDKVVVLASSNSVYKKEKKELFMKKYLYMLPVEIYGDYRYTEQLIQKCITLLQNKKNILVFPEGVYSTNNDINRGHTIAARIAMKALESNISFHFVPISIKIEGIEKDKASIDFTHEKCKIHFLREINLIKYWLKYQNTISKNQSNQIFHSLIDDAMSAIAIDLKKNYIKNYKPYVEKKEIITIDGQLNSIDILCKKEYFELYKEDIKCRTENILRQELDK